MNVLDRFTLKGKKALVTGGNRGLGKAFATALAQAGAVVAIVDRMTRTAIDALGGLGILVNNAGTCFHNESWNVTDSEWSQVFDLNVRALWKCSLAAGRHMADAGGARS